MALRLGLDKHGAWLEPSGGEGIRLNANASTVGLFVSKTGSVGIGTHVDEPAAKLEISGTVKAKAIDTGDVVFRKDGKAIWRLFEEPSGLYLENLGTGRSSRIFLEDDMAAIRSELDDLRRRVSMLEI